MEEMSLEKYIDHGIDALLQRKSYIINLMQSTTNPLEKLSCKDRIEEIDNALSYFRGYANFKSGVNNK